MRPEGTKRVVAVRADIEKRVKRARVGRSHRRFRSRATRRWSEGSSWPAFLTTIWRERRLGAGFALPYAQSRLQTGAPACRYFNRVVRNAG